MEESKAIALLSALGHRTRLQAFRRLVAAGPQGLTAGELARALSIPQSTLSNHLAVLVRIGLLDSERRARSIIYRSELRPLAEVLRFLIVDCCARQAALVQTLATLLDTDTPGTRQARRQRSNR